MTASGRRFSNALNANPTKWSNTFKQLVGKLPTNCLSVFDHFVGLAFKVLKRLVTAITIKDGKVLGSEYLSRGCKACVLNLVIKTFEEWKLCHVFKLNISGSAGNTEIIGPRACLGTSMTKNELNIRHLIFMVTAKTFELLKIHIQASQSKN